MPTAKEVLNKIKWSKDIKKSELWYLHRGAPDDTMIISGKDIIALHHSFMELESETMIPYHRILKIFYYRESIPFPSTEKSKIFPRMLGKMLCIFPSHTLKNLFHKFSRDEELIWEKPFSSLKCNGKR